MSNDDLILLLGNDWSEVKALIKRSLGSDVPLLDEINSSLLDNAGKMLRPMLTLFSAKLCGAGIVSGESINGAAAVEILHNATLLHDDVADEAETRRGQPTVLSKYGPVPAVLVGDFWLAKAVGLLTGSSHLQWVVNVCARTLTDLAEGEMLQQQKAFSSDTTVEDYLRIIYCKTASLFETACKIGAVSVDAPSEFVKAVGNYGRAMGMAFQIQDDILDYAGSAATGKPVGIDLLERKITLPLLGAIERTGSGECIRSMIRDIPEHPEYCHEITRFVLDNGGVEYAKKKLGAYVKEAVSALEVFPESQFRSALEFIAGQSAHRVK